jgi:hypothetical protein
MSWKSEGEGGRREEGGEMKEDAFLIVPCFMIREGEGRSEER